MMALTTLDIIFDEYEMAEIERLAKTSRITARDFVYRLVKNELRKAEVGEKS